MKHITVVGASLAGLSAVRSLRAEGFEGEITVVGEELHRPYDRPPLSKAYLKGDVTADALELGDAEEYEALDIHWELGDRAVHLDCFNTSVILGNGRRIETDGVVVATGSTARRLPGTEGLAGVHTLRTLDDARSLRTELVSGVPRMVVIGAGFIGAEVAATAHHLGLDVTVVEALDTPLERQLGAEMGRLCASLHTDHGVRLLCGSGVAELESGGGRVTGVRLTDGRLLPADIVLVGVGARPVDDWLADSGVWVDNGVVCDAGGASSVPNVVAVGDVARRPHPFTGRHARIEHWSNATDSAATAARTLLTGESAVPRATPPSFWSDQYDVRIQLAGVVNPGAELELVEGSYESRSFAALYKEDGVPTAVLAMNRSKIFNRLRRTLVPATERIAPAAV
ncbi:NAD(P)/FAD-dependent oxidoreductase [Streptomyces sp. NPDC051684]|uniref:NAD(P)/FAD-dependent oxidoreductase n=1 Tax=Streptomyces sp. NPDC051684 TaxID=3365670 RepID=UPI0037872C5F